MPTCWGMALRPLVAEHIERAEERYQGAAQGWAAMRCPLRSFWHHCLLVAQQELRHGEAETAEEEMLLEPEGAQGCRGEEICPGQQGAGRQRDRSLPAASASHSSEGLGWKGLRWLSHAPREISSALSILLPVPQVRTVARASPELICSSSSTLGTKSKAFALHENKLSCS